LSLSENQKEREIMSDTRENQEAGARDNEEHELEAEEESAAAMDADVPQPPGASETTEGQPS
jgi:hypothetical protein